MIGIGGLARAGKDTLASNLTDIISEDWGISVQVFAIADILKERINPFISKEFGISAFSENTEDKKIIRPILVSYGESMKTKYGHNFWLSELYSHKECTWSDNKVFPIISDTRFDFEVKSVQERGGQVIHITKQGNLPPNEIEALNDPLVAKEADLNHTWPAYNSDQVDKCMDHAHILWQMLKQTHEEKWKKTYT